MIDQAMIKRRDMLLVASSMFAAAAVSAIPAAAETQMPAQPKSETHIPPPVITPDEPYTSASRGRRAS
jgi:hypothetical protein